MDPQELELAATQCVERCRQSDRVAICVAQFAARLGGRGLTAAQFEPFIQSVTKRIAALDDSRGQVD
jgi:hypothetical protein